MKLIAETAWHHEGDYNFMKNLLSKIIKSTNADIIKMHITLDLDKYMDQKHDAYKYLKPMLFNKQQWQNLIVMVKKSNKELMLLLNDVEAIKFASKFNPEYIELHSVCLNVPNLQNSVIKNFKKKTKIVIGVGGCTIKEIDRSIKFFKNRDIVLMFGFQNYPTKYEDINIAKIRKIQNLYPNKLYGYADHTAWNEENNELITLLVASNGMKYIEKHVTIAYGKKRNDYSATISIKMFNSLHKKIKVLERVYGDGVLKLNRGEQIYSQYGPMKMAGLSNYSLKKGDLISLKDVSFRRTKKKTDLSQVDLIDMINKRSLIKPILKNEIFKKKHFI